MKELLAFHRILNRDRIRREWIILDGEFLNGSTEVFWIMFAGVRVEFHGMLCFFPRWSFVLRQISGAVRDCCSGLGADGSDCFEHSNLKPSIGLSCSPPISLLKLHYGARR